MEKRTDYFKCQICGILSNPTTTRNVGKGKPLKPLAVCPNCDKEMSDITKEQFEKEIVGKKKLVHNGKGLTIQNTKTGDYVQIQMEK